MSKEHRVFLWHLHKPVEIALQPAALFTRVLLRSLNGMSMDYPWNFRKNNRIINLIQGCQTRFSSRATLGIFNLKRAGPVKSLHNILL